MTAKERIDELRIKKGWSLNKLADELGLTNSAVYSWYRKEGYSPSIKSIEKACEVFGISITEFYSCVDNDNMAINETLMMDSFRKVPPEGQEKLLKIAKIFEEN
jgi:transcriptional regulator with XRE-family HTH domain